MKPPGISSGMCEHHDCRAVERGVVALAPPRPHLLSVRRIAEDGLSAPILAKAVLSLGEEFYALRVGGRCARIKREVELLVEKPEEVGRRCPLF